ncbi:MmgE/PrpD family protein [Cupriavidus sp. 2TAF22]|uniref:MmgE/PrpD family protein n=1 Tax=unclassified Cupriavidus TaxID=2640874 RepID=UPI003F8F0FF1
MSQPDKRAREGNGPDAAAGITALAARFAVDASLAFPAEALSIAKLSIFDWFAVGLAGANEPVSKVVRAMVASDGGTPGASVIGLNQRVPARAAALANGAASHALDYDDTHFAFVGHPTVAVFPAALAVAQQQQASGKALLEAFLAGVETVCGVGAYLGRKHYNAGFHQTATSGTFGATAACARLLGLDAGQARHALGIASTRASGLKSQFGSMGKPFHAGMAASNGIEAATLAALGFVSRPDGIECAGGFAATHAGEADEPHAAFGCRPHDFRFADVQYKYHACCHGTHPAVEALLALRSRHRLVPEDLARVTLFIHPQWLPVCCIERPRTGLEVKFSLPLIAAMVLSGIDTAALESFSDAACEAPGLAEVAGRVVLEGDARLADTSARVVIETRSGATYGEEVDLAKPVALSVKSAKLRAKASALLGSERAQRLYAFVDGLESVPAHSLSSLVHSHIAATPS